MTTNINPLTMVASPCIRNCCLDNNDICIGCFRSISEIIDWHQASDAEKATILSQCQLRQQALLIPSSD